MGPKMNDVHLRRTGPLPMLNKPPLLLHPLVLFSTIWLGVVFLYSLHLSNLLIYSTEEVIRTVLVIWAPFAVVTVIGTLFYRILIYLYPSFRKPLPIDLVAFERKLVVWFRIWLIITVIEIGVSGGLPLLWLIQGSAKTYRDFGISSLHGLVNSLLLSIGACRFILFLLTGKRKHLYVPVFILVWSILVVTRNMLLVSLIEFAILAFRLVSIRTTTIVKFVLGTVVLILVFGAVGDYRSGSSDLIKIWAQPTKEYPDWLPSGVLWAYIYVATPINNLVHTSEVVQPINSPVFPNTVVTLFPTVIRDIVYGSKVGDAESGELVTATFNVSTAYIGPFQDFGFWGIGFFSAVIAIACLCSWLQNSLKSILIFAVLSQCLVLSLFFNHFFYLPVISQIFWIFYFIRTKPNQITNYRLTMKEALLP